jgi:hypothetical protein
MPDTKQALENFVMLLTVLLGANHPQTQFNQLLLTSLWQKMHLLDNIMSSDVTQAHLLALLLRRPQVEFSSWVEAQLRSNAPILPDTTTNVVTQASMRIMSWKVPLPSAYVQVVPPSTQHQPPPMPNRAAGSGSGGTGSGDGSGGETPDRSMVLNCNPDPRFDRFRERRVQSHVVKQRCHEQGIALPTRVNGATRCLPFHIVHRCNNNCNSRDDHVNDHTDSEQADMEQWYEAHWHA